MLRKNYSKTGKKCRVTFVLPADAGAEAVCLVGEFNDWDPAAHQMKQLKNGSFSVSMWLKSDETYRFRYFLDNAKWENDWDADAYVPNEYGGEDSVLNT